MSSAATNSSSTGSSTGLSKQVIYVDVDDEITTIIDKMNASNARIVALVLPKRASVFQSVINMKLLKRRADAAKKNLVLISSEAGLMPLAGMAGVYVAPTLQSKPEIPAGLLQQAAASDADEEEMATMDTDLESDSENDGTEFDPVSAAGVPVGALAGQSTAVSALNPGAIANTGGNLGSDSAFDSSKKGKKADKKLQVPNFFTFRKRLILGGLLVVLIAVGWYFAYVVLPKATVTIKTSSSDINSTLDITLDTAAAKADLTKLIVPAQSKQEQKSNTQQVAATGQENRGEKANGSVVMTASICGVPSSPADVPAGTGISSNGLTFITQKTSSFNYDGIKGGCIRFKSDTVGVVAQKGGTGYNITSAEFTVAGRSADVTANGSTSAGTDNNVKVVQQSDIDAAKQKLTAAQDQSALKRQLQQNLEADSLFALPETFNAGMPNVNTNSNVGDEAENVTVTQSITYTMFGVRKDDLSKLVEASAAKKIDTSKQSLLDDGLANAKVTVPAGGTGPQLKISLAVTSTAGPKLDVEAIKRDIIGLKSGNVQDKIKQNIGVTDVQVRYSPFWVTKAPKAERTTVVFETSNDGVNSDSR